MGISSLSVHGAMMTIKEKSCKVTIPKNGVKDAQPRILKKESTRKWLFF
jgi:hypothetical protein